MESETGLSNQQIGILPEKNPRAMPGIFTAIDRYSSYVQTVTP